MLDLSSDTRRAEEIAVSDPANIGIELKNGADEAAAFELPEGATSPSQDEVEEDDVSEAGDTVLAQDWQAIEGTGCIYRSRLIKSQVKAFLRRLTDSKPLRRLTGMRELPGMMSQRCFVFSTRY